MAAVLQDRFGGSVPLDDYCNTDEVRMACVNLALRYPALAERIDLPEATYEGNPMQALRIGAPAPQGIKPVFMAIGALHGNEWGSSEILLNLAADLLGSYSERKGLTYGNAGFQYSDTEVGDLLNEIDFVLLPLANPDGRRHAQDHVYNWRKNRNPADRIGADEDTVGVDLNRNFAFLFEFTTAMAPGTSTSISDQPVQSTYRGQRAFSEPETRNIQWLLARFPQTRWFADLHCGSQAIIHPWSDDEIQHTHVTMDFRAQAHDGQRGLPGDAYREYVELGDWNAMQALAKVFADTVKAVSDTDYPVKQGFEFTPSCASSHDWVYARHRIAQDPALKTLAFAIEWHAGTEVFWHEMPKIIEDVCAGLIAMARAAALSPP
jgi:murein tripeptide amidase MpaA